MLDNAQHNHDPPIWIIELCGAVIDYDLVEKTAQSICRVLRSFNPEQTELASDDDECQIHIRISLSKHDQQLYVQLLDGLVPDGVTATHSWEDNNVST